MNEVKEYSLGKYVIHELKNSESKSWMKVAPERGGIIISLGFQDEEILFLNEETFLNEKANIRGGIPILFPISGQLMNGMYELNGQHYKMNNHGVARDQPWQVVGINTENELSISLVLDSSDVTKKSYPFDFQLQFKYVLERGRLIIHQEYINKSKTEMPIYAGFHPYFKTSGKRWEFKTDTQSYLDYNDMKIKKYEGSLDLTDKKEAMVLLDAKENKVRFLPQERNVTIEYDSIFKYVVVWSEAGQDFMCVEPWMAKPYELNYKKELLYIQPGQSLKTVLSIVVD